MELTDNECLKSLVMSEDSMSIGMLILVYVTKRAVTKVTRNEKCVKFTRRDSMNATVNNAREEISLLVVSVNIADVGFTVMS